MQINLESAATPRNSFAMVLVDSQRIDENFAAEIESLCCSLD
jgi:hypothetical protein